MTKIRDGEELKALQSQAKNLSGVAVMDASDWKVMYSPPSSDRSNTNPISSNTLNFLLLCSVMLLTERVNEVLRWWVNQF